MQTIYLDISNKGVIPVIYAKQGDVGRKVEVILTNSGLPYEPEAGSAFSAWFSGASGVGNYTDIGDHSAFSVSGNKVTVELITQMLQNAGEGVLCLVLSRANGDQIGLWNIRYICEGVPGAGSEPAKDYYTAFSQAVAGLAYPDSSLSVAGKAADAEATGKALAGKAPAGYGLGTNGTYVEEIDNLFGTGVYLWEDSIQYPFRAGLCLHIERFESGAYATQYCFRSDAYSTTMCVRNKAEGKWGEWEWDNPPMIPGVEYRTTERWNGKAVYAKAVNVGTLPARASRISVVHGASAKTIVRYSGTMSDGTAMPYGYSTTLPKLIDLSVAKDGQIHIWTSDTESSDFSVWTGTVQTWYTKD